jgi:hypothetical protein
MWILGIFAILVVVLILAAPWIVAKTGLRDTAINAILASPSVTASSQSASFGWFSPLSIHGLQLNSANKRIDIRVEDITSDESPLQVWKSSPDLGTIRVEKPHVTLELPLDVKIERAQRLELEPTFTAVVKDAALTVRVPDLDVPAIDVDGINMTFRVEKADGGRVLTLDPLVVFDKRKLSPKLADKCLHLIDPTLGDISDLGGEISLSLDKLRVPLGISKDELATRIEVEGNLSFHQVSSKVKSPLRQALVHLVADMNGKHPSDVLRVVQDGEARFQVRNGRLHHEGLHITVPDIDPGFKINSSGSVGLDRTLDLHVELPHLDPVERKERGPAKCRVTGTITNPKISVQNASLVMRQPERKEAIIAAHGIDMNMEIENTDSGRVLAVAPIQIFKKDKLSLGLADGLLKLIVPDFQSTGTVAGDISLSFKKLRIPLGAGKDELIKRLEAVGTLTLHQITAEAKTPMAQAVLKVLADMNGKPTPNMIRISEDSEIHFQMRGGRLVYDGMRIGVPDFDPGLQITSRGSVGLDETLDLHVEIPHLDPVARKERGPARCHLTGTIDNPKLSVQNASLVLRQPERKEPIIAAHGIDMNMQVEKTASGRVIAVAPVQIFKKDKLSLGLADGLVRLIAPDLHSSGKVAGDISLSFEKLRIPLGVADDQLLARLEAEGTLTLQKVSAVAKNPMALVLLKVLADMHGKPPPDVIRIVDESKIHLQMRDGKLVYDGMRIGIPEIDPALVVSSRGSVGLDETIDLNLELPRLLTAKSQGKGPVPCRITGTITNPKIAVDGASLVVHLAGGKKPSLTVDNLHLKFSVDSTKEGRVLTLAPVTVFEKLKLTPEVGDELLHMVVPTLADATGVQGEISLSLDTFRVPLDVPENELEKRIELAGKLRLHEISADAKTPLLGALVKVLADMHGKKPSEIVRVVKNADVGFQVRGGRVYAQGLRLGLPDIDPKLLVTLSGSVGLDKSLDLELEIPRVPSPLKKELDDSKAPVRLRITGTFDKPVVKEIKGDKVKETKGEAMIPLPNAPRLSWVVPYACCTSALLGLPMGGEAQPAQTTEIKAVVRISKELIDDVVSRVEVIGTIPYDARVMGFRVRGVADGQGRLTTELTTDQGKGTAIVRGEGAGQSYARASLGPVVATAYVTAPFAARTVLHFDGRKFSRGETSPWVGLHVELDRLEGRRGRLPGRVAGRLLRPAARLMIPRVEARATPIADYYLTKFVEDLADEIVGRLNRTTAVEKSLNRLFPETKDWGFQLSTDANFIQAAYGPPGSEAIVLPENPNRLKNARLELWLHSSTKGAEAMAKLSKSPLAKQLIQRYLEATLPELAALAEERSVAAVGSWIVISIGPPKAK